MLMKIFEKKGEKIVAVCDSELLGNVYREGETVLDLDSHSHFYNGEKSDKTAVKDALESATSANLVGKKSVSVAVEMGLVSEGEILKVQEIPHAQIYKL